MAWVDIINRRIKSLRAVPRSVPIAYWEMCCQAADDMELLRNVVLAHERNQDYVRDYIDGDASDDAWSDLQSAIDSLESIK